MRNAIAKFLEDDLMQIAGTLTRTGTSTWESPAMDPGGAAKVLSFILEQLAHPEKTAGTNSDTMLDHLWIYVDKAAQ